MYIYKYYHTKLPYISFSTKILAVLFCFFFSFGFVPFYSLFAHYSFSPGGVFVSPVRLLTTSATFVAIFSVHTCEREWKKKSNKYAVESRINNQIEWTSQDIYRSNFVTGQKSVNHFQQNQSMCEEEVRENVRHKIKCLPETRLIENYLAFMFGSTAKRFLCERNLLMLFYEAIE